MFRYLGKVYVLSLCGSIHTTCVNTKFCQSLWKYLWIFSQMQMICALCWGKWRWAPPHNTISFSCKLSKTMKTPEYLWLHPVTRCPQVGYDDMLAYSWDHFSQSIHVWRLQATQPAFSWELEKNSWELSKTLQSFFKHPFLKLSFSSFPQTSWDKFFPLFIP